MQCPHCGKHNPDAAKYCTECGSPLSRQSESQASQTPPVPGAQHASSPNATFDLYARYGRPPIPKGLDVPDYAPTSSDVPTPGTPPAPNEATAPSNPPSPYDLDAAGDAPTPLPDDYVKPIDTPTDGKPPAPGDLDATSETPTPGNPPAPDDSSPQDQAKAGKKRRTGKIVGIVVAVVVVLAAVSVGVVLCTGVLGKNGLFSNVNTHGVTFRVNIAGGYDDHSSRIPVQITGTDANGNEVDETIFMAYSGVDVELPEGSYEAKVLGSPISSTGTVYKVPEFVARFTLDSSLQKDETYILPNNQAFSFVSIDPKDLTDEQVEDAIAWARKDEKSNADVGTLEKAIEKSRTEAKH